ncbi:hypothetical protein VPH49_19000 [Pseudomonas luteola]|uniref:hypothetical protein n=1 Tax=Pseudomonas luteola TaxID=47886 RepID=UPI0002DFD80F|nr:hypothetical protein [Pseudomonas luteola]
MPQQRRFEINAKRLSTQRLTFVFVSLVISTLTVMGCWQVWTAYNEALEQAEANTSNLTRSIAQHAENSIKEVVTLIIGASALLQ